MALSSESKILFGKYRGRKLKECPDSYLKWMTQTMTKESFAEWGVAAQEELDLRKALGGGDLEAQADAILRANNAGDLVKKGRKW